MLRCVLACVTSDFSFYYPHLTLFYPYPSLIPSLCLYLSCSFFNLIILGTVNSCLCFLSFPRLSLLCPYHLSVLSSVLCALFPLCNISLILFLLHSFAFVCLVFHPASPSPHPSTSPFLPFSPRRLNLFLLGKPQRDDSGLRVLQKISEPTTRSFLE